MDQRFLRFYNSELEHLREVGSEFAREFPKIAGRLGMSPDSKDEVADPFVERLLEGFAFLAARIQLKIDAEFPRFTQQIFETVYPHYLCPTPSMSMVQFEPDLTEGALGEGPVVSRRSVLRSMLGKGEQTRCTYTTAHDVRLWPLEIEEVEYHTRDLSVLNIPDSGKAKAAIRVRLRITAGLKFEEIPLDELVLHVRGMGGIAMRLYEQLFSHVTAVVVHPASRPTPWHEMLPASVVRQVGFSEDEALLPYGARSFQGYRLLHEYFAFSDRFMFVAIKGLKQAVQRCEDTLIDVTLLLSQTDLELEQVLSAENFALFCTPAINLFEKRLDRIHLNDRFPEFHLVSDRTAPLDYEVHSVTSVIGYGARGQTEEQEFESFYRAKDNDPGEAGCYYAIHRTSRMLSEREHRGRRRSISYAGSEAYLSLVDINAAPYRPDIRQLGIVALCTNRDLPLHMALGQGSTDFTLDTGAPVRAIRCLGIPTPPCASHAEGEFSWRLISHLQLNYLSIVDTEGGDAASALGDLLGLYGDMARADVRKQIEGIRETTSRRIVRRVGRSGPTAFGQGLEISVTMDESAFEGTGVFLLGAVLAHFFSKYVSINSFTETVIKTLQRAEVKRWPATIGLRHVL